MTPSKKRFPNSLTTSPIIRHSQAHQTHPLRKVADIGRHHVVEAMAGEHKVAAILNGPAPQQGDTVQLQFRPDQTRVYADGWIASTPATEESAA